MSEELEQGVIAILLNDNSRLSDCDLMPHHFKSNACSYIYEKLLDITNQGRTVDLITMAEGETGEIRNFIVGLLDAYYSSAGLPDYVEMMKKKYREREAIRLASDILYDSENGGLDMSIVDKSIADFIALSAQSSIYDRSVKEILPKTVEQIEEAFESEGLSGLTTGISELDEMTGGLHNTDLIIIAARPAMGKTAFLLNMALAANEAVGIFSAEQPGEQAVGRKIAITGSVDSNRMRHGTLIDTDWPKLTAAVSMLSGETGERIRINDEPEINIAKLQQQARAWKRDYDIKAIYTDYLQIIGGDNPGSTRRETVINVAQSLKNLAKELKIPVVALAQVKREVESRPDKRPMPSDIAEAGIEPIADLIISLYRDEVYNQDTEYPGIAEIIAGKSRHGPTGVVRTQWIAPYMQFKNIKPTQEI